MYILDHKKFCLQELVWKSIYDYYQAKGQLWVLWRKFDPNFLKTLEQLHSIFGTAVINNWSFKNPISWLNNQVFEHSGARPLNLVCNPSECEFFIAGNPFIIASEKKLWGQGTTHCDWNTADVKFKRCYSDKYERRKKNYDEIREQILDNPELFPYITVLESGDYAPTWLHVSTGNFDHENRSVRIVKP